MRVKVKDILVDDVYEDARGEFTVREITNYGDGKVDLLLSLDSSPRGVWTPFSAEETVEIRRPQFR